MSPSCVAAIFGGDNGGATSAGVSGTEIRVGIPGLDPAATADRALVQALFDYMNRRFELYGRRLTPVYAAGGSTDAVSARALGANLASQGVFAALAGFQEGRESNSLRGMQVGLVHELARSGVVTITRNAGSGWADRLLFDPLHPFVWSVYPSAEANLANLADLACTALAGRLASHARDAALRSQERRFGVVVMGQQTTPPASTLIDALTACDRAPLTFQWNGYSSTGAADVRTGIERLRSGGATTIVCVCESLHAYWTAVPAANQLGYGPEWVVLPSPLFTEEVVPQYDGHGAAFVRLDSGPRLLRLQERPWFGPLVASDPSFAANTAGLRNLMRVGAMVYEGLLMLASGVQSAGPALTPDTFAAGLMSTQFPNPGAGQAPAWQPSAGFGPGDHSFYDDYAVAWWSDTAPAVEPWTQRPQGSWCYIGGGTRFQAGSFPADIDARLFNPAEPC